MSIQPILKLFLGSLTGIEETAEVRVDILESIGVQKLVSGRPGYVAEEKLAILEALTLLKRQLVLEMK